MNLRLTLTWIIGIESLLLADALISPKASGKEPLARLSTLHSRVTMASLADGMEETTGHISKRPGFLRLRGGGDKSTSSATNALVREMIAELIGTFLIVFIGTGSVSSAIFTDSLVGLFQIASVWIIAVTIAICTTASISGAHLNPAISVAFAIFRPSKSFNWKKVLPYSAAQCIGAVIGSWLNLVLYGSSIAAFEASNSIVRGSASGIASAKAFGEYFVSPVTKFIAFLAEATGTAILAFVIFALTHPKNDTMKDGFVPPLIGLTVGSLIAVIAPLTQAGFNPARDFGPRIVAWFAGWKTVAFANAWLYIVAPIVGAVIGAACVERVLYADDSN